MWKPFCFALFFSLIFGNNVKMSKNKSNFLWRSERKCYFWHSEHEASESEVTFTFKCQLYSWHLKFIHKTQRKTSSSDLFAKFNFYIKMSCLVSKIPKSIRKEKKRLLFFKLHVALILFVQCQLECTVSATYLQTEMQQTSTLALALRFKWRQKERQRLLCDSVSYTNTHQKTLFQS